MVTTDSNGVESYNLVQHSTKGSTVANLLGGLPNPPRLPQNVQTFTVSVNQVSYCNMYKQCGYNYIVDYNSQY